MSVAAGISIFIKTQIDTGRVKDKNYYFLVQVISKHFSRFIYSVYWPTIIYLVWDEFAWVALH